MEENITILEMLKESEIWFPTQGIKKPMFTERQKQALEFVIEETKKADECYQYCRKQEEKINNLYHENESLKYRLSVEKLKVKEKKEELEKELEELEKKSSLEMRFSDWQIIDNTRNKIQVLKEILGEEGGE